MIGCRTLRRALNAKPGESEEWTVENAAELFQYAVENTHPQTKLRRLAAARLEEAGAGGRRHKVSHFANSCRTIKRWNGKSPACRSGGEEVNLTEAATGSWIEFGHCRWLNQRTADRLHVS